MTSDARVFFLCFSLLVTAACSQEDDKYFIPPKVEFSQTKCLSETAVYFEKYLSGNAVASEVISSWQCLSKVMLTFRTYVKGSDPNEYTSDEIRHFVERYFISDHQPKNVDGHKISNALLDELMGIKRLFLGGSRRSLTMREIDKTLFIIENLSRISLDFLPDSKILISETNQKYSSDQFNQAANSFRIAMQKIVSLIDKEQSRYEFSQLTRLLDEIQKYIEAGDPKSSKEPISKYVPLLSSIKGILLNSDVSVIKENEWGGFSSVLSQIASIAFRVNKYFTIPHLYKLDSLLPMKQVNDEVLDLLFTAIEIRHQNPIRYEEIETLIRIMGQLSLLPLDLNEKNGVELLRPILTAYLTPKVQVENSGLTLEKLNFLQNELNNYWHIQRQLIKSSDLVSSEMEFVLSGPWALRTDSHSRIIFDRDEHDLISNIESSSRMNWLRALLRLLFIHYDKSSEEVSFHWKIQEADMMKAYLDIKPLLLALDLVNDSDMNYYKKLYRDANLFMPRSDGDNTLSFIETLEYVHLVLGAVDAGDGLIHTFEKECNSGKKLWDIGCFRENFWNYKMDVFAHMKHLLNYFATSAPSQWQKDVDGLEIIVRGYLNAKEPISDSDIFESFVVLQYVESVMMRFDADKNDLLDLNEAIQALTVFENIIAQLTGIDPVLNKDEIQSLFTYMLNYGELPLPKDPLAQMRYFNWKLKKADWNLSAGRGRLIQIISALSRL